MKAESKFGGHYRLNDKRKWVKVNAPVQEELDFLQDFTGPGKSDCVFLDDFSYAPKEVEEATLSLVMNQKVRFGTPGESKSDIFKRLNKGRINAWYPNKVPVVVHKAVEVEPEDYKGLPIIIPAKEKNLLVNRVGVYLPSEEEMDEMYEEYVKLNPCTECHWKEDCQQLSGTCEELRRWENL